MAWLLIIVICALFAVSAFVSWRKWIAPWRRIDELVRQVARNERPRTFLVDGGIQAQRVGLALENIFACRQQLDQQIAGRESGTQTILGAMQDGVLVVDARRYIVLMNRTFEKLFELRDATTGVPLLETVRNATLDRLIAETLRTGEAMRSELSLSDSQTNTERRVEVGDRPEAAFEKEHAIGHHGIAFRHPRDHARIECLHQLDHQHRALCGEQRGGEPDLVAIAGLRKFMKDQPLAH